MRRKLSMLCATALLIGGAGIGCATKNHAVRDKPPSDPLLVTKKPVEGKPNAFDPVRAVYHEPPPPPLPVPDVTIVDGPRTGPGARLLGLQPVPPR